MAWMHEPEDRELLAEFARKGSEAAFAALVARYVNLVYSTALRFTGNTHHAEEVAQAVFIILANKAGGLSPQVVLSGWLYQTARLASANFMKSEIRRRRREQEAYMESALNESKDDGWREIAPLLDEAMGKLGQADRDAVVLRFFQNKTAAEIGLALKMSEEAARKRVNRALERLHLYFRRQGVSSTTGIIAGAISNHSVQAAPNALAGVVTVAATASTPAVVNATLKLMIWQKMKMALVIGCSVVIAGGTATVLARHLTQPNMQTNAVIPYDVLDDACRITDGMDQSKLVVHTVISSNLKTVNPANIQLTIESKTKGTIPLKLGSKGQILDFPHDEELRSENPDIVSDQPKNTLGLGAWFYLPMPEELTFPYGRLADAVSEAKRGKEVADSVIKSGGYGQALPFTDNVPGVVLVFARSSANSATLEIDASAGRKIYSANQQGDIILPIDDALRAENPTVKISEKALWVVPYFNRGSGRQFAKKFSG